MRKSKILMVMTALVLAVVGVLAAVTSVLSAQQQSVTSSLQVTYQANNVSATVSVKGKTQGGSYAAATGTTSKTFTPAESQAANAVALAAPVLGLGFTRSSESFDRYGVYQFEFINNYAKNHGCALYITMTDGYSTSGKNVIVRYAVSTSATEPAVTLTESSGVATGVSGESNTNTQQSTWLSVVPAKTTLAVTTGDTATKIYFYVLVIIADPTLAISSYENNSITFSLSSSAS